MKPGKSNCGCGGGNRSIPEYPTLTGQSRISNTRRAPKPGHPVSAPAETLFFSNVRFDFPRRSFRAL